MRLADGATEYEGRVELCFSAVWGTVCDDEWGVADALVVCKQLGLPTACKIVTIIHNAFTLLIIIVLYY